MATAVNAAGNEASRLPKGIRRKLRLGFGNALEQSLARKGKVGYAAQAAQRRGPQPCMWWLDFNSEGHWIGRYFSCIMPCSLRMRLLSSSLTLTTSFSS